MKTRWSALLMVLVLSLITTGCEALNPSDDEALVSVISTQVDALPTIYQWLFDNESGCAIEVVISESTLTQAEGTDIGSALKTWTPIMLPVGARNIPVDSRVLGPDYDGSFPWPLSLTEFIAPNATADPTCDWLPKEVQVQGPQAGNNTVTSIILAQGDIKTK